MASNDLTTEHRPKQKEAWNSLPYTTSLLHLGKQTPRTVSLLFDPPFNKITLLITISGLF